ncbi:parallel beta-helix domain-containing protein [Vibrio sp. SCSIO 43136]|uniref:parallel beta-helix domain-containing protein n=1 Tax=Vibrio sp. SCSIO 43136 TaxID=2819101 RepID=UPI00207503C0|nr:parallel beta-helix domain-containing protein [Vibrio sp. SCSIO 43136]USD66070.1 right-handed parallel beta-helix repeat-containing protein [Vibrio sp. SCSIO 43136]
MKHIKVCGFVAVIGAMTLIGCNNELELAQPSSSYETSKYKVPTTCPDGMSWQSEAQSYVIANQLAFMGDGETLQLPEGCYKFDYELTLSNRKNITIKGAGMDKTFLDFSESSGGEGIAILDSENVTLEDFQVSEAAKNAIKVTNTDGLIIRRVAAIWMQVPRLPDEKGSLRGTYALYPVSSKNILIEDTWSYGSADAGIYVGQSENIVVRNNVAEKNIAGIEIENSKNADVYDNLALGNTGGMLVFDLPGAATGSTINTGQATVANPTTGNLSSNVRVFNNVFRDNNLDNYVREACRPDCGFAGGVHIVPPGTGVIVLSARDTEIYNNVISGHDSMAVTVTSYLIAEDDTNKYIPGQGQEGDAIQWGWNPVPTNVYIHNNQISNTGNYPRGDLIDDIVKGYTLTHQAFPNILYDGVGEANIRLGQIGDQIGQDLGFKPIADALTSGYSALIGMGLVPADFWLYLKEWEAQDNFCAHDNGANTSFGSLFDATNPTAIDPSNPSFVFEASQANLFNCQGVSQPGATATIGGVIYGYNNN